MLAYANRLACAWIPHHGGMCMMSFCASLVCVGQGTDSVNIRTRDNQVHGTKTVEETIAMLKQYEREHTKEV